MCGCHRAIIPCATMASCQMETSLNNCGTGVMVSRAQRFSLRLLLRYRIHGEAAWRSGEAVNMSTTGVLFNGDREARKGMQVDLSIDLPGKQDSLLGPRIVARGTIVRCVPGETQPLIAVSMTGARLIRSSLPVTQITTSSARRVRETPLQ